MGIEVGSIVPGKVSHVADFGAFVVFEEIDERTKKPFEGLVHISEVANEFVKDIHQYVAVGDSISVKILGVNKQGKLELSIKKAQVTEKPDALFLHNKTSNKAAFDDEFEDILTSYLKKSEEKQVDLRRNLKKKQGVKKKR